MTCGPICDVPITDTNTAQSSIMVHIDLTDGPTMEWIATEDRNGCKHGQKRSDMLVKHGISRVLNLLTHHFNQLFPEVVELRISAADFMHRTTAIRPTDLVE